MNIFFLVPFFLVASFGIYEASALETITTEHNFDTDNGDGTRTVRTHHPYVFDGNNWVPFIASGTQVQTHMGSVTLNGTGYFQWNGKFNDSIKAKYADISDLNTWTYPNTLNNDVPDISWDGSQLVSEKNKAGVANLKYKYVFDNGKWKTQLEVTNLSALTTKVFGFDQTINLNSDTIKFGGITRNLDNFDGQTFDKEFLIANEGKVIDLLNGINFDFDLGFENLYSITVYDTGINKSQLVFDYRTSEVLLPGETLIIDPTFNSGASTNDGRIFSTAAAGAACSATYSGIATTANINVRRSDAINDDCSASYFNFDISGAGNITSVTSATIEFDIVTSSSPLNCDFIHKATVFQGDQDSWTALLSYTGATVVKNNVSECASGVADGYVVAFDSNIYPLIVADANSDGTVSIGVGFDNWARDGTTHRFDFRNNDAVLEFDYTVTPAPDSITDLTADTVGSTTASLSFTPPNLNGESLINYMLNVTTPQQDTPPTTFWMNGSSSPFAVTGLTFGTDYSASASAYTAGGGNWTLANVLNFTTTTTTYSTPPTSLVATAESSSQIDLDWVAPAAMDDINGYRIQRETPIGAGWVTIVSNTTNTNAYYNNTGLSTNIIYNYRVYALNGTGISTASNQYDMTTFHLPDAVTDLTGTATDLSTIDLSWSAPTSYAPEIEGYMINGTTPTGDPVDILNSNTGTDATTATAVNILIGQEYSFRVSPITVHGKNASGNIWNGSTVQTFVIGDLSNPDITNDDDFTIFFERTDLNSSAVQLDVTYPDSYDLSCDFSYKYARTNQTYSSLTTVPDGADDQTATFILINATGDLIQVRCWDPVSGDESIYVITITDFPFLEQVNALRNGEYGTFFQIGAFDGVMLIVIFLGMIGLNRTTPIVGIIFVVITTFVMSYFQLITYPVIMYPALIMMIVWAFVTTRKDD